MTIKVRANYGGVWVEADVGNVKDAICVLAPFAAVFTEPGCGICKSSAIVPEHRQDNEGHDYYSLKCSACGAQLSFGQTKKDKTLFPKRKDTDNKWLDNRGWFHWKDRKADATGENSG